MYVLQKFSLFKSLKLLDIFINFELKIQDKLHRVDALYRFPSQTEDIFCFFHRALNLSWKSYQKIIHTIAIDDFNSKHRHWYSQDTNNSQGTSVENVGSQFGLNLDYSK